MLELAKQEVQSIQYAKIRNAAVSVKNEDLEMIAKVRERKGRLDLPIVGGLTGSIKKALPNIPKCVSGCRTFWNRERR